MNKQAISKLNLFISGIISRYLENKDIFLGIKGEYKSGTISYPFTILCADKYILSFQKDNKNGEFEELLDLLIHSANLYDELNLIYSDRTGTLIIKADNRSVTTKTDNKPIEFEEKDQKKHLIPPKKAQKMLEAIDFVTNDGKIKNSHTRKYTQAENFIELLIPYIEKLPKDKQVCIYDLACGKSYLSFFLNFYLTDILKRKCKIIGLDINKSVIDASNEIKDKLKYHNMEFIEANILEFEPKTDVDIAISLHACDVATDYAIATAINNSAKIVAIVPCCHKEFLDSLKNESLDFIFRYGIMKKRFSDILTDVYRAKVLEENGYNITMTEFVSPLDTPKNLLILGIKDRKIKTDMVDDIEKNFNLNPILNKLIF
jgi:SAM-dependent methyltransferase